MKKGCIKKLLSVFLVALIISMVPITSVPVNAATTPAAVDDATVKVRFDKLRSALVGKYFTVDQTYCMKPGESGHPPENDCDNCYNANVIKTNWLKNCVDLIPEDIELIPGHFTSSGSITNNAWSCAGFANFVEWYLYAQKSTDDVYVKKLGNASVSYNGLKSVGAKIGNVLRSSGGHSVVLYGYDSDSMSYIQCNGTRTSDGNCKVTFYDCSYSTFSSSFGSTVAVTQATNASSLGKVTITNGSSFQAGDVKFTWNAASGATSYNIKIWKIENDVTETLFYDNTGVSSGCTYNLENGNYRYVIQAVNSNGYTETEARLFVGQRFVPSTYFTYSGNLYEIYEFPKTWEESNEFCNNIGGHLVTIKSEEEQAIIEEYIQNSQNQYLWIGASDIETEGTFKWVTDETFDYTNWDTLGDTEPNDANGGEDYACIKTVDSTVNLMGSWNDSGSTSTYGFICEYENINDKEPSATTIYNGHIYDLYDYKLPAIQAELFAQREGGHLVSLNSAEEEKIVVELMSQGTMTYYWLGAMRFDVNTYKYSDNLIWSTGEEITYKNYGEGEPNNDGGEEWFVEYVSFYSAWNDCANNGPAKVGFIVERPVEYTVTYDFSDAINGPENQIKYHSESLYLSFTVPEKEGYTFLGWTTSANATTIEYAPGDEYTLNENVTLYALWSLDHLHNYDYVTTLAPTCTESGMATLTCECGDEYTEEIPAKGHENTTWVTEQEPTCDVPGYKDEYCLDCGELINTESIPATGHLNTTWVIEEEPTCDVPGYKDEYCLECGEKVGTEEIPATGHNLSTEWTIDVEPTCTENGSKSHHCTVCGEKGDITVIVSLGHDFKVISTEEEHPHTISYKCSRCTETKEETSISSDCALCNFSYTNVDDETCKITGYIGNASSFVIPGTISGRTVTTTTTGAFKNNTTLTSVRIENGVQGLGSLAFLGCTSLSKIVIPESVLSIGTNAFYNCADDFTIYCYRDTYAMQYAVDNSIDYVIMDVGETNNSIIDYKNELIYTFKKCITNLCDILNIPSTSMAFAEASHISGNKEFLGTGTKITVFDNNEISSEYTLVVEGDLNGDSVCDVLDCVDVQKASSGFKQLEGAYLKAGDADDNGEIDVTDYQSIVNSALAG